MNELCSSYAQALIRLAKKLAHLLKSPKRQNLILPLDKNNVRLPAAQCFLEADAFAGSLTEKRLCTEVLYAIIAARILFVTE